MMKLGTARPIDLAAFTDTPAAQQVAASGIMTQLWRRKLLFSLVFVAVTGLVLVVIVMLPTRYKAAGSIIVAQQEPMGGDSSAAWVQKLGDPADLESHLLRIASSRMMREVLNRPGITAAIGQECEMLRTQSQVTALIDRLRHTPPCSALTADPDSMLDWITDRYSVASAGRSRVISVSYGSPSAKIAETMTNALIAAYLSVELNEKLESRTSAVSWLNQEITQLGDDLRREDLAIQTFRRSHGLIRGQLAPISSEQLTATAQQLAAAQGAQADAAAKLAELDGGKRAGETRAVLESLTITNLKQQLAQVSGQLANATATYGRNHPLVAQLRQQTDDIAGRLAHETQAIASSAQRTFAASAAQVSGLSRQLDTLKQDVGSTTDSEAAIASMVRDAEIKRELYVDLSKKASGMETDRRVMTGDTHLVAYAELPLLPAFPKKPPFAAAGLVLALLLATIVALLRDRADHSVRAAGGVEVLTGIPVLAQIPVAGRGPGRGVLTLSDALRQLQMPSALQETIRSLHAQMLLAGTSERLRTLMVTSSSPREGKTFTTLALAQFAAASGRRVLLIEADLRCPSFQNGMSIDAEMGLSDYLEGRAGFDDIVTRSVHPRLDVIVAGRPHIRSTELLSGPQLERLLEHAEDYDLVLIDSPPSEVLMDARMMSRHVDGVLYCARWGKTETAWVANGIRGIQEAGGRVVGVAVTMMRQGEYALYDARPLRNQPYLLTN